MKHSHLLQIVVSSGRSLRAVSSSAGAQPPQQPPPAGADRPGPRGTAAATDDEPSGAAQGHAAARSDRPHAGVQAGDSASDCAYCHVDEGRGGRTDFAADEKPTKATARVMMRLTDDINTKLAERPRQGQSRSPSAASPATAACSIPKQLPAILTDTADRQRHARPRSRSIAICGSSTTAAWRTTSARTGSCSYATAAAATKPDDAIQWLQVNLEFYPKSTRTYLALAQIYSRKQDKDNAIKSVEKALEIEPDNAQAKRLLEQLKTGH